MFNTHDRLVNPVPSTLYYDKKSHDTAKMAVSCDIQS